MIDFMTLFLLYVILNICLLINLLIIQQDKIIEDSDEPIEMLIGQIYIGLLVASPLFIYYFIKNLVRGNQYE